MADLAALGALGSSLSWSTLEHGLEQSLDFLRDATGAEGAEIFLSEPAGRGMALTSYRGPFRQAFFQIPRFNAGEGFPGLVMSSRRPIVTQDLPRDPRYLRDAVKQQGFQAYACVPCPGPGGIMGSLQVAFRRRGADVTRAYHVLSWASNPIGMALGAAVLERRELARTRLAALHHTSRPGLLPTARQTLQELVQAAGAQGGTLALFGLGAHGQPLHQDLVGFVPRDALEGVAALGARAPHRVSQALRVVHHLCGGFAVGTDHAQGMVGPGAAPRNAAVLRGHPHPAACGADAA